MSNTAETEPWAEERARLEEWRRCLHGIGPARCPPLGLVCTCRDCIDPAVLKRIEGAPIESMDHELAGAYFGAAGAYRRNGTPVGATEPADAHREEARFFFVKLAEALIDSVMDDDDACTILRGIWFVEPCHWHDRLLATGFVEALSKDERDTLAGFFKDLCWIAYMRQSARLWDCVEHMGVFSDALPDVVADLRAMPIAAQIRFWAPILGGDLYTPAGEDGTLAIDLREEITLLTPEQIAPLVEAFSNPALGRYLHLAAVMAKDTKVQGIALRALALWDNSAAAMALPDFRRHEDF